ncbi:MAG: hypothetical protein ACM3XS_01880 [Bacteroidota bacterium]
MRRFTIILVAGFLILAFGRSALAVGRFGATDLMYVPTSGTLADGAFGLYGNFSEGWTTLGMDVGLVPNLEMGVVADIWQDVQQASLRAKFHLLVEKKDGFGLTVGVQDIGLDYISPYLVLGKTIANGVQGYLGVGGGWYNGVFCGLNFQPSSMRGHSLFLEYDSYTLNLGGRFRLSGGLGVDVGVEDLQHVVVGVSYVSSF